MVCADVLCHRNRAFVAFSRLSSIRSIPSRGRIWGRGTMRLSCNGCRVLRKGCSDSCVLRPCLQWIETAESQANATVFLAKFYGRAGLMNLIADGPEHLRPAIFRSLLYEACGRMVNPIHGSVGLLMSGNWQSCEAGVESILQGHPICHPHSNLGNDNVSEPDPGQYVQSSGNSLLMKSIAKELHKVKSRGRFRCNGSRNARGKKRLRELAGSDEDKIACASSERRSIVMADKAQSSRYCNDSSSESDRNEDDDRYNSCESNIQILSMICKSPKVENEYHACADDCSDVVGLELTLGSPRIPNDGKSYSGNTSQSCAEGRSLVMCSTLSLT